MNLEGKLLSVQCMGGDALRYNLCLSRGRGIGPVLVDFFEVIPEEYIGRDVKIKQDFQDGKVKQSISLIGGAKEGISRHIKAEYEYSTEYEFNHYKSIYKK